MAHLKILFQGSHKSGGKRRNDTPEQMRLAEPIAIALGDGLIRDGLDLILTGIRSLDALVGRSAVAACNDLSIDPRERIRTYVWRRNSKASERFGMMLKPLDKRWQEIRTFLVQEADAVVSLIGGKGTSDVLQKAVLAKKPVFPIAVVGGASQIEWERLKRSRYPNDIDFLADHSSDISSTVATIAKQCSELLGSKKKQLSRRIFIVHGHDVGLKNELARFLGRLDFIPIILHEQPDKGQTVFAKLHSELSDVGFAFVLLTPDDLGASFASRDQQNKRARQNVVFEHGLLSGHLGPERVCAIVKDAVEMPTDLQGILYKHIPSSQGLNSILFELVKELKSAGYKVDANKL